MKMTFLGASPCNFDPCGDAPCYLINEELLVDCGWHVTGTLKEIGYDFGKLKTILMTHWHHDHYLGLAGLLFHIIQTGCLPIEELTIAGPPEDLEKVFALTWDFMQFERYYKGVKKPKLLPVMPGDVLETETLSILAGNSVHPVEARRYRITEKETGTALGLSGDTSPAVQPSDGADFFRGCAALVHDAACGWSCGDPAVLLRWGHSTVLDAASLAQDAGIPLLYPVHMAQDALETAVRRYAEEFPDSGVRLLAAHRGDRAEF